MGPRSFDRGNEVDGGKREGVRMASMGPRSFDRGNYVTGVRPMCGRIASMGPRSFDRGNGEWAFDKFAPESLQWGRDRSIAEIASILTYSDFKDLGACLRAVLPRIGCNKIRLLSKSLKLLMVQQQITCERFRRFCRRPTARPSLTCYEHRILSD